MTIADQYYIKALDSYPYDLETAMENLNYALGYDGEHAGGNYLMGRLLIEYLNDLDQAEEHFNKVLAIKSEFIPVYEFHSHLLILKRKFKHAQKLIQFSYGIEGIDEGKMLRMEALLHEYEGDFRKARKLLKKSLTRVYDQDYATFVKDELSRVKDKIPRARNKKKKAKKK